MMLKYIPCYFEDGKRFSNLGPVVIIPFRKNIFNKVTNIYNSNNEPWWKNIIDINNYRNICFYNNQNIVKYYA